MGKKTLYLEPYVYLERHDAEQLKEGEEITLCQWGNVIVQEIKRAGNAVKTIIAKTNPKGSFKGTKKLTWIPAGNAVKTIKATLVELDYLITTPKLPDDKPWESVITPKTWFETEVLLEPAAKDKVAKGNK